VLLCAKSGAVARTALGCPLRGLATWCGLTALCAAPRLERANAGDI
jgi:hypothetical protein